MTKLDQWIEEVKKNNAVSGGPVGHEMIIQASLDLPRAIRIIERMRCEFQEISDGEWERISKKVEGEFEK